METEQEQLPPPPGLVTTMLRGFDTVANHVLLIVPPVLLDLFLWLGPHLRLNSFFQPVIDNLPTLAGSFPNAATNVADVKNALSQFNLFIFLRTFPIGITSLFSLKMPAQTPWGNPPGFDAGSLLGVFGWCIILALLGWFVGSYYFYAISSMVVKPPEHSYWKTVKQTVLLSFIWLVVLLIFGMPVLLFVTAVFFINAFLGQLMLFIVALLLAWLLMPVFFSAHGIFLSQMDAMRAILNSLRMVRFTLPNTGLFLLVLVVINIGLSFLWNSSPPNSWLLLVGIAGHAFISTALLAASFIYYRDINTWLTIVFEQLQRQARSAKI